MAPGGTRERAAAKSVYPDAGLATAELRGGRLDGGGRSGHGSDPELTVVADSHPASPTGGGSQLPPRHWGSCSLADPLVESSRLGHGPADIGGSGAGDLVGVD